MKKQPNGKAAFSVTFAIQNIYWLNNISNQKFEETQMKLFNRTSYWPYKCLDWKSYYVPNHNSYCSKQEIGKPNDGYVMVYLS